MKRAERYAQLRALRDEGLLLREIAARTGLSISTVNGVLCDPTGERARARKARNDGTCADCGARTGSSGARTPPRRCRPCANAQEASIGVRRRKSARLRGRVKWTDDEILGVLRGFADGQRLTGVAYDTARRAAAVPLPSRATVELRYGSWARACDAAGLTGCHRDTGPPPISPAVCLDALARCAIDLGRAFPAYADYEEWHAFTPGTPSGSIIRRRLGGSWVSALDALAAERAAA